MKARFFSLAKAVKGRLGPLAWGSLLVFLLSRVSDLSTLATKAVLGKWLAGLDFGAIEPIISVITFVALPISIVYQVAVKSISRLTAQGHIEQCTCFQRDLAIFAAVGSGFCTCLIFAFRSLILSRLHLDSMSYIVLMSLMCVLAWLSPMLSAVTQGKMNYRLMMIPAVVGPVLVLTLSVLWVPVCGYGLQGALLARTVGALLGSVVFLVVVKDMFLGPRKSYKDELVVMGQMLVPMAVYLSMHTMLMHFDRLFIRNFLVQDSGGYGAVITLGQIPLWFISPVIFVIFPLSAAEHASGREVNRFFAQALLIGGVCTAVFALFYLVAARPVLQLWNPGFAPYAKYVWVYALAMGLQGIIEIIVSVEMGRHCYGGLWGLAVPVALMCAGIYLFKSHIDLGRIIWIVCGVRAVIIACMLALNRAGRAPAVQSA